MLAEDMKICKIDNSAEYLSLINAKDADAEFYDEVSGNDECVYAIYHKNNVVGLAYISGCSQRI